MVEPENLVLKLLQDIRADQSRLDSKVENVLSKMATKDDIADVRSEVHSLRADVASDMLLLERRLGDQFSTLRPAVMEYHSSTIGHGVLYSEIEQRVRRIEQHLKLDAQ